jgi:hypothetical protein
MKGSHEKRKPQGIAELPASHRSARRLSPLKPHSRRDWRYLHHWRLFVLSIAPCRIFVVDAARRLREVN